MTMSVVQVDLISTGTFFLLLALSVPVPMSLAVSSVPTVACVMDLGLATFVVNQKMITGMDSFSLIAVPFFILCDVPMNLGGITQKLINLAKLFVGFILDGPAHANILGSTLFGSISDSSAAASTVVRGVIVPLEEKEECDRKFVVVADIIPAPTGLIIPPSEILIIYVVLPSYSVTGMIMNGYIPGFMWYIAYMVMTFVIVKKNKYPTIKAVPAKVFIHTFIDAVPGLLLITIIVGGVRSDTLTATESTAVAAAYTLFPSIVCYRTIKIKNLSAISCDACGTTAVIMFLITAPSTMSFVMSFTGLPTAIGKAMLSIPSNPYVVLLMINIIFLIVDTFTGIAPAALIFAPIFLPVVKSFGMHPTYFSIIIIMNPGIGNITPPVGSVLFSNCSIAGIDMEDMIKPILPSYGAIFAAPMLVAYVSWFSMVIPTLVGVVQNREKKYLTTAFNVLDFGAKADRVADGAPTIQTAIDVCSKAGGGRVVLESGKHFYSGSITLKGNADLHLKRGAVLQAHKALEHCFHPNAGQGDDGVERVGAPVALKPSYVFIYAEDVGNIAISGEGATNGNAYAFVRQVSPYYVTDSFYPRPTLVYAEHCNHVSLKDIIMRNTPFWTLHPVGCDDVLISGLRILSDLNVANSDGIDLDHSANVRIVGCRVTCTDDCIYLKSSSGNMEYGPLKNVVISGRTPAPASAALKVGAEGAGDFENMVADNCVISDSNHGISIQIRDGGDVKDASFLNTITEIGRLAECWWGCVKPITMSTHDRSERTKPGRISNARSSNITYDSENGVSLSGGRGSRVEDILFESVRVVVRAKDKQPREMYDLHPGYGQRIEEVKTSGSYMRRADHVVLRDCQVKFEGKEKNDFSHALYTGECRDMTPKNFRGQATSSNLGNVVIRQDRL